MTVDEWIFKNPGLLAKASRRLRVSRTFISNIVRSKMASRDGVIEGILADLGAPGMRERHLKLKAKNDPWTRSEIRRLTAQLKRIQAQIRKKGAAA